MATQTPAVEFWTQYLHSVMKPLIESCGAYTDSEQASHLKFLADHVAPNLGSLPTEPHHIYTMNHSDSPVEPSINLMSDTQARARLGYSVVLPSEKDVSDPFGEEIARDVLLRTAAACGGDTQWLNSLIKSLWLTPAEAEATRDKIPPFAPTSILAFDFADSKVMMKAYFPGVRKAFAQGRTFSNVLLDAVRNLDPLGPQLEPSIDLVEEWLAECKHDIQPIFLGVDCVDPNKEKARVKLYLYSSSNAFAVVRDIMTLGGRLDDDITRKRIEMLHSIWDLLRDEVGGEHAADDNWSKPERIPGTPFRMQYNIELTPDKAALETKCYVPVFQFADSAAVVEKNLEAILTKVGHEWGSSGRFRQTMDTVL